MRKERSYLTLLNPKLVRGLLSLAFKGYFVQRGWLDAYTKRESTDANGDPIPWLTYSFLDFLNGRLRKDMTLFEYGSGNSTLYFAKYLKFVRSIEHNESWYHKVISYIPIEKGVDGYIDAITAVVQTFDIILIDGRERVSCVKNAIDKLTENGVLILDDSEREAYKEAFSFMQERGFKHLLFSGIAIGAIHDKSTTVFYRPDNILGI
jgi:hypothetical protein